MKNIILVCSAGMSTSLLVNKIIAEAERTNTKIKIRAIAESELPAVKSTESIDLILLGPQVKYMLEKVQGIVKDDHTIVDVINLQKYGMMDGLGILQDIAKLIHIETELVLNDDGTKATAENVSETTPASSTEEKPAKQEKNEEEPKGLMASLKKLFGSK